MQGPSVKHGLTTRAARLGATFLAAVFILYSLTLSDTKAQDATPGALATPVSVLSSGAAGFGDPYYPLLGNGGYDVEHYTIALDIDVAAGTLNDATTTIEAVATQDLSAFNLDFRGPEIDEVTVNGRAADWSRDGGELVIAPQHPLALGVPFEVMVHYHGMPDGDDDRFEKGWWATGNSVFALGEPRGSDVWYPVNGHPLDKATYTLEITVPEEYEVVANGHRREVAIADGLDGQSTRTVVWENDDPTASYLVTFHVAQMDVSIEERPDGITLVEAFPPSVDDQSRTVLVDVPEMMEFFESIFGPYPFTTLGSTVFEDTSFNAALETQGLISYDASSVRENTVAHEIAHQWFGNSVSPERWQDIWLNEGFARYSEILWAEHAHGEEAAMAALRRQMSSFANASRGTDGEQVLIGDPGPEHLFSEAVYAGGALLLDDLRQRLGDETFFTLLRAWATQFKYGNASTDDFISLAEDVSGEDLDAFFHDWLLTPWTPERVADRYALNATPFT
jgi:aminopeptidase N